MENPIRIDDLGVVPLFLETPIYQLLSCGPVKQSLCKVVQAPSPSGQNCSTITVACVEALGT